MYFKYIKNQYDMANADYFSSGLPLPQIQFDFESNEDNHIVSFEQHNEYFRKIIPN